MDAQLIGLFHEAFGGEPAIVCRAPGRIEFIGNHTDYNGGPVLGAAIDRGVWVAVRAREDGRRRFCSAWRGGADVVEQTGEPVRMTGDAAWINYPLGVLAGLPRFGAPAPGGFDFAVVSDLPTGAGLSSSAAIELASALAFLALGAAELPREEVVQLGRWAENEFVGVPCGILDQGVSGFGRRDHLVFIDCRGPEFATVPLMASAHFWVFNTPSGHALVDGLYAARHRECMEAARILGVECLAEAKTVDVEAARGKLGEVVFRRARHVTTEIARVAEVRSRIGAGDLAGVGRLLVGSHRSSQHDFENSTPQLDSLVDLLEGHAGVFGARLTGGGFGGAAMALTDARFDQAAAERVGRAFAERWGAPPQILHLRTADGAARVR